MVSCNPIDSLKVITNHISVRAAAKYRVYSLQYLRRLLRNSKVEGIKIGPTWLVDIDALNTYIEKAQYITGQRLEDI